MTLDEAITILEGEEGWRRGLEQFRRADALLLAIEAMNWFSVHRKRNWRMVPKLLPGETED